MANRESLSVQDDNDRSAQDEELNELSDEALDNLLSHTSVDTHAYPK